MREFLNKHVVLKAIAALGIFEVINLSLRFLFDRLGISFVTNGEFLVRELIVKVAPVILIAFLFGTLGTLKEFSFKSFFKTQLSGIVMYITIISGLIAGLYVMYSGGKSYKSPIEIVFYFLFMIGIGFSEELLFRGTLYTIIKGKEDTSKKRTILAIVVSSLLFGVAHFTNLFMGQGLIDTINQVVLAAGIGFIFSAVYSKHKNLYGLMFIHSAIDFVGMWSQGLVEAGTVASNTPDSSVNMLLGTLFDELFLIIVGIIILVPKKKLFKKSKKKVAVDYAA